MLAMKSYLSWSTLLLGFVASLPISSGGMDLVRCKSRHPTLAEVDHSVKLWSFVLNKKSLFEQSLFIGIAKTI